MGAYPTAARSRNNSLVWLASTLDACVGFPARVRIRFGCELVSLRRLGFSASWKRVRGAAGAMSLSMRVSEPRVAPRVYSLVAVALVPDVFTLVHAFSRVPSRGDSGFPRKDVGFVRARVNDVILDAQEQHTGRSGRVVQIELTSNVFSQLGFADDESDVLLRKAELVANARRQMRRRVGDGRDGAMYRAIAEGDLTVVSIGSLVAILESLSPQEA